MNILLFSILFLYFFLIKFNSNLLLDDSISELTCFIFANESHPYLDAISICEDQNSYLVSVPNETVNDFLYRKFNSINICTLHMI